MPGLYGIKLGTYWREGQFLRPSHAISPAPASAPAPAFQRSLCRHSLVYLDNHVPLATLASLRELARASSSPLLSLLAVLRFLALLNTCFLALELNSFVLSLFSPLSAPRRAAELSRSSLLRLNLLRIRPDIRASDSRRPPATSRCIPTRTPS